MRNAATQYFDIPGKGSSNPIKTITLHNNSGVTILAGYAVALDETQTTVDLGAGIKMAAVADPQMVIGGAVRDIPTGTFGEVQVYGVQENVYVPTGTAAKTVLIGGTVIGRLAAQGAAHAATERPVALCLTLAAADRATVFWTNPLGSP
jgi:hypothetical protein